MKQLGYYDLVPGPTYTAVVNGEPVGKNYRINADNFSLENDGGPAVMQWEGCSYIPVQKDLYFIPNDVVEYEKAYQGLMMGCGLDTPDAPPVNVLGMKEGVVYEAEGNGPRLAREGNVIYSVDRFNNTLQNELDGVNLSLSMKFKPVGEVILEAI